MNERIIELSLEKKLRRLECEDELLTFFVDSSVEWGNMTDQEFELFQEQVYDLIMNFVKEKGAAQ